MKRIILLVSVILVNACGDYVENSHPTQKAPADAPVIILDRNEKNQLILNWNVQEDAQNYTVYLSSSNDFEASKTEEIKLAHPPYIIKATNTSQRIVVKLKSNWSDNESPQSNQIIFNTPPLAPENLTSEVINDSTKLSWTSVENIDSYTLFRSTSNDREESEVTDFNNVASPYQDTTVIANQKYYYWLVANEEGQASAYSEMASVMVVVEDNNQKPVITVVEYDIDENSSIIATVQATDDNDLVYEIVGGDDANLFSLVGENGELTFNNPPDFETPGDFDKNNEYKIIVKVSDGEKSDQQTLLITVNDLDDVVITENPAPVITSPDAININENIAEITTIQASDDDNLTYIITGGEDGGLFSLNSESGELTFNNPPDYEMPTDTGADNIYKLDIQVSDGNKTDQQSFTITVQDIDDDLPVVNFASASVNVEENNGPAKLTVILDKADTENTISLSIRTAADTATTDDFTVIKNQEISLQAGETQLSFDVNINNDNLYEGPNTEAFSVVLSSVSGATVGSQAIATIIINDDEPLPEGPKVTAIYPGYDQVVDSSLKQVDVTFDKDMDADTINVDTFRVLGPDNSFVSGSVDYNQENKVATFKLSESLLSDVLYRIELHTYIKDVNGSSLAALFTSRFNTTLPKINLGDIEVAEEEKNAVIMLSLNSASGSAITLDYRTINDSAISGSDYEEQSGSITFDAGETEKTIDLIIHDDDAYELDELFTVKLSNIQGSTPEKTEAQVIITDDNDLPQLSITDAAEVETDKKLTFNVSFTLNKASDFPVQVDYATEDDSALAASDYQARNGTLIFPPGEVSINSLFSIDGDTNIENDEQFLINLSQAVGARIVKGQSVVTIQNDDIPPAPELSVLNGDGVVTLTWTDIPGASSYNVYYARQNGVSPGTYGAMNGTVLLDQSSDLILSNLKLWVDYYFVVTALVGSIESPPSVEKFLRTKIIPLHPLNDTGIIFGGEDSENNNSDCNGMVIDQQDCSHGRDLTYADNSDGHAGFSYTKLDSNGNDLDADASSWECVRDNVTGLIWEVKQAAQSGGLRDTNWTYSWFNSTGINDSGASGTANGGICFDATNCDTEKFTALVNAETLCGFSDWRAPSYAELESLLNLNNLLPIDTAYFPNTLDMRYASLGRRFWSSSPNATVSDNAWFVEFSDAIIINPISRSSRLHVRLVRGGSTL